MVKTLKVGDVVRHSSGKTYEVIGNLDGSVMRAYERPDRVGVVGLKNGKPFGPIRFVDEDDLTEER